MLKKVFFGLFLSAMALISAHAGDVAKGKALYATCMACHGANGEGNPLEAISAPSFAGLSDWYIIQQLKNFKAGIRGTHAKDAKGMIMRNMTLALTDEGMADIAAYIKTLKRPKPKATLKGDAVKGKVVYNTCLACHGPNGKGNKALGAPNITELSDWYMLRQLNNFKTGIRGGPKDPKGMMMAPMVKAMTEQQFKDVIAYVRSLK